MGISVDDESEDEAVERLFRESMNDLPEVNFSTREVHHSADDLRTVADRTKKVIQEVTKKKKKIQKLNKGGFIHPDKPDHWKQIKYYGTLVFLAALFIMIIFAFTNKEKVENIKKLKNKTS